MNSNPRGSSSLPDNRTIHVYRDPPSVQAAWHNTQPNHRSGVARLGRKPQPHTDENTAPHAHTAPPAGERSLIRLFARLHRQQEGLTPQDDNTIHQRKEVHRLVRMPALLQTARAVRVEQIVGVDCFEQTALPPRLLVEPKPHHLPWGEVRISLYALLRD
ncbi:hypothetical protein EYR40_007352 [Pleurotus pulmonarius]|nr:hypothetical protein EYR36_003368 [Pleurotus pulmonarius]KAF4600240.1 hypothetical protein EYR40_007352 [Pleurotus pulmonarius]